jgi:hypothetical protein
MLRAGTRRQASLLLVFFVPSEDEDLRTTVGLYFTGAARLRVEAVRVLTRGFFLAAGFLSQLATLLSSSDETAAALRLRVVAVIVRGIFGSSFASFALMAAWCLPLVELSSSVSVPKMLYVECERASPATAALVGAEGATVLAAAFVAATVTATLTGTGGGARTPGKRIGPQALGRPSSELCRRRNNQPSFQ